MCDVLECFQEFGKNSGGGFGECRGRGSGKKFAEKIEIGVAADSDLRCGGPQNRLKPAGGFGVDEAGVFSGGEHFILVGIRRCREAQMGGCGEGGLGGVATGIRPADLLIIAGGHDGESFKSGLFGPFVNVAEDGELTKAVTEWKEGCRLIDEQQQVGFGKRFEEFADLNAEFGGIDGIGRWSAAGVQLEEFGQLNAAWQQESWRLVFGRGGCGALIGNRQDLQPENDGRVGFADAFDAADGAENGIEFADCRSAAKFDRIEI